MPMMENESGWECMLMPPLQDFHWLADDLVMHPIRMLKVVPSATPVIRGACNASDKGTGGVLFIPQLDGSTTPNLW
jgi:hypothetical protein